MNATRIIPEGQLLRPALPDKLLSLVMSYSYEYEDNISASILSVTAPLILASRLTCGIEAMIPGKNFKCSYSLHRSFIE